jgi:hypothetical protein
MKTFELMRYYMTKDYKEVNSEELQHLYSSPSNVKVIKSRRMQRIVPVATDKCIENFGDKTSESKYC